MNSLKFFVKNETHNRMCRFGDGGWQQWSRKGIVCTNGGSGGISCTRGNACDIFRRRGT